jgi:molecular chaperone DnaK
MHAEEDKKEKERIDTRNRAESMIFQTEKQLKEFEGKISDDIKGPIESGIEELKKAKEADDIEKMQSVMQEIESHLMKLGEEIYKQTGEAAPGAEEPAGNSDPAASEQNSNASSSDGDVVDAEIVDDDK